MVAVALFIQIIVVLVGPGRQAREKRRKMRREQKRQSGTNSVCKQFRSILPTDDLPCRIRSFGQHGKASNYFYVNITE